MSIAQKPEARYTYRDYLTWPDDERWELIEGVPHAMTPAPTSDHQGVVTELSAQLTLWLRGQKCKAFVSPIDVILANPEETDEDITTIVQPDLIVVCDAKKIVKRGIRGAPDFVLEVLSPSTASHDQITKAALYEKHGVKEFWVVDLEERLVTVRTRTEAGQFAAVRFIKAEGKVPVSLFEGFEFDFDIAFARISEP